MLPSQQSQPLPGTTMTKRADSPHKKIPLRRLLLIRALAIAHCLTGFPGRAMQGRRPRRRGHCQFNNNTLAQNDPWRASANRPLQTPSIPVSPTVLPLAQSPDVMAGFAHLRQNLPRPRQGPFGRRWLGSPAPSGHGLPCLTAERLCLALSFPYHILRGLILMRLPRR